MQKVMLLVDGRSNKIHTVKQAHPPQDAPHPASCSSSANGSSSGPKRNVVLLVDHEATRP